MSNTDYRKANAYMAEECGVEVSTEYWVYKDHRYWGDWNIKCAVCREIIREHYGLATDRFVEGIWSCFPRAGNNFTDWLGKGETIAEAEIGCILAIVEAKSNG